MKQNILNFILAIVIAYAFIFLGMHLEADYGESKKILHTIETDFIPELKKVKTELTSTQNQLQKELKTVQERNNILGNALSSRDIPPNHHISCVLKLTNLHEDILSLTVYAAMYQTNIDLSADAQYRYSKNNDSVAVAVNFPFKCWHMQPNQHGILAPIEEPNATNKQ